MRLICKKFLSVTLAICSLFALAACDEIVQSETGIFSLAAEDLSDENFYVGVNHGSYELKVVSSEDYNASAICVVIDDPSVVEVTYNYADTWLFTGFKFNINCLKAGSASFYFETTDSVVKSDPITIIVQENISSITLSESSNLSFYSWQDTETISFDYEAAHSIYDIDNAFLFVSEDPTIATFEYDKDGSWFTENCIITAVSPGETYVYIQTKDGSVQSQKLKVIIPTEEKESSPTEDDSPTNEEVQDDGRTVYVTPYGKKYHYSKSCAGKNASEISEDDAKKIYDPCKKCT